MFQIVNLLMVPINIFNISNDLNSNFNDYQVRI